MPIQGGSPRPDRPLCHTPRIDRPLFPIEDRRPMSRRTRSTLLAGLALLAPLPALADDPAPAPAPAGTVSFM